MWLLGQLQTFWFFLNEKISHTQKAQKALKGTKALRQKHKTQIRK